MYAIRQFQHKSGPELHGPFPTTTPTAGLDGMLTSRFTHYWGWGERRNVSNAPPGSGGGGIPRWRWRGGDGGGPGGGVVAVAAVPVVVEVAGLVAAVAVVAVAVAVDSHGRRRKSSLQRRPDDRGDRHLQSRQPGQSGRYSELAVLWRGRPMSLVSARGLGLAALREPEGFSLPFDSLTNEATLDKWLAARPPDPGSLAVLHSDCAESTRVQSVYPEAGGPL